jgi:hypothetical protein
MGQVQIFKIELTDRASAVNTMPEGSDDSMRWGIAAGLRSRAAAVGG